MSSKQTYLNLLSIGHHFKSIPYGGSGIKREDGNANYGFKNLKGKPELIDSIPELKTDSALKSLVQSINSSETSFFSIGCLSGEASEDRGYRYSGYIEFSFNCKIGIQDASNYFPLFLRFEMWLHKQNFEQQMKFYWVLEPGAFLDANVNGFSCTVFFNTAYFKSIEEAYECWTISLKVLESFLSSQKYELHEPIY